MTDLHQPDHWPDLQRLPDPLQGQELPSVDDPSARALLAAITDRPRDGVTGHPRWRGRFALVAAVAVVAFGAAVWSIDRDSPADTTARFTAIDQTAALDSGQLEIANARALDGITVTDTATVRFRGDDEDIVSRPDPSKALIDVELGSSGFIPELLEIRTVDGQSYMRVTAEEADEFSNRWDRATYEGPSSYVTFAEQVRRIVEGAGELDLCDGGEGEGVTAYCLSTVDDADVRQFVEELESFATADIRIEISDSTGLLSTFQLQATEVTLRNGGRPFDLPVYDRVTSVWEFQPIDPNWRPEVPDLG